MKKQQIKKIKEVYDRLLEEQFGSFIFHSSDIGDFAPADIDSIYEIFEEIGLKKGQKVVDLGGGDGRFAVIASLFGAKGVAIELDNYISSIGNEAINKRLKGFFDNELVEYRPNEDLFNYSINDADVIVYYEGSGAGTKNVEEKILREAKQEAIVILYGYIESKGGFQNLKLLKKLKLHVEVVIYKAEKKDIMVKVL